MGVTSAVLERLRRGKWNRLALRVETPMTLLRGASAEGACPRNTEDGAPSSVRVSAGKVHGSCIATTRSVDGERSRR